MIYALLIHHLFFFYFYFFSFPSLIVFHAISFVAVVVCHLNVCLFLMVFAIHLCIWCLFLLLFSLHFSCHYLCEKLKNIAFILLGLLLCCGLVFILGFQLESSKSKIIIEYFASVSVVCHSPCQFSIRFI